VATSAPFVWKSGLSFDLLIALIIKKQIAVNYYGMKVSSAKVK